MDNSMQKSRTPCHCEPTGRSNLLMIFLLCIGVLLLPLTAWATPPWWVSAAKPKQPTVVTCTGAHLLRTCVGRNCKESYCPTGQYCVIPPAVTMAQCVQPSAEQSVGCAGKMVKKQLVVGTQTIQVLDACPTPIDVCVGTGQCAKPGELTCTDSDGTSTGDAMLLAWSQDNNKVGALADPSLQQAGGVTTGIAGVDPKTYVFIPDVCKGADFLQEQVCTDKNQIASVSIKCSAVHAGATCHTSTVTLSVSGTILTKTAGSCALDLGTVTPQCPVGNILTKAEILPVDQDGNGIYDSCEFPQRFNIKPDGTQAGDAHGAHLNMDGRYITFQSMTDKLDAAGKGAGNSNIYLRDRLTATTTYILDSGVGDMVAIEAPLDAGGQYVALSSTITPGTGAKGQRDIFVYDRATTALKQISASIDYGQANSGASEPAISDNGRFVAYASDRDAAVPDDTEISDVLLYDTLLQQTIRVTQNPDGQGGDNWSAHPAFNGDGQILVFQSQATNLLAKQPPPMGMQIYLFDQSKKEIQLVSVASTGAGGNGVSNRPDVDGSGRYITFLSFATNLVPDDANGAMGDLFLYDRDLKAMQRIHSVGTYDSSQIALRPRISADGRYIVFASSEKNIVAGDTDDFIDAFVYDRNTATTALVSRNGSGAKGNGNSYFAAISGDGRFIVFSSWASNLVSQDTNDWVDGFITINPLWTPPIP